MVSQVHQFPYPPVVPFGIGRESGVQLPGEWIWVQLMVTSGHLRQTGIKVGMAEPA